MHRLILSAAAAVAFVASNLHAVTIDRLDTANDLFEGATPTRGMVVTATPTVYHLSDGSTWPSGAGSFVGGYATLTNEQVTGSTLRYTLQMIVVPDSVPSLMDYIDYDSGQHSSAGRIEPYGPLVLQATIGSNVATLSGFGLVVRDQPVNYAPPLFNYYTAPVGSIVPISAQYTLRSGTTWQPGIAATNYAYRTQGSVDFANYQLVPEPTSLVGVATIVIALRRKRAA